jgi:hypothetical protein
MRIEELPDKAETEIEITRPVKISFEFVYKCVTRIAENSCQILKLLINNQDVLRIYF